MVESIFAVGRKVALKIEILSMKKEKYPLSNSNVRKEKLVSKDFTN